LHFGLLIVLILTGIFEFASAVAANAALNDWSLRVGIISTVFNALTDFMICLVFWILTNEK
jgi:hypothetical protein